MSRALVTGAGGFIGHHLVARLVADGWDVVPIVRPGSPSHRARRSGSAQAWPVDLTDPEVIRAAVTAADPDVVFHLAAARAGGTAPERAATTAVNAHSGALIVEAVGERCRAVVALGSSTEYAAAAGPMDERSTVQPRGFFGATKAAGGLLLTATAAERGIRSTLLRAFQVYGPGDHAHRLVPTVLRAARTRQVVPLTMTGRRRDWVWVEDVVQACVLAAERHDLPAGAVLNIGTGCQTANEELVAVAERVTGCPISTRVGAHPGRSWDTDSWVCDPALAGQALGWRPTVQLAEGIERIWSAR